MSQAAPPWVAGRTRRSGAKRRAQAMRAEARVVTRLLKCFSQLHHRGCGNSVLGNALAKALLPVEGAVADPHTALAPERPPGVFFPTGVWEPLHSGYVQATTTSRVQPASAAAAAAAAAPRLSPEEPLIPSLHEELVSSFNGEIVRMQSIHPGARDRQRAARLCDVMDIMEVLEEAG